MFNHWYISQQILEQQRKIYQRAATKTKTFECPYCNSQLLYERMRTSHLEIEIWTCYKCWKVFHREDLGNE